MAHRLTQRDLAVMYLSEIGGWIRVQTMRGKPFKERFLGGEVDRRMIEVLKIQREQGYYKIGDYQYVIEEGKEGRYKIYRVMNPKPRIEYELKFRDGMPVRVPRLINL